MSARLHSIISQRVKEKAKQRGLEDWGSISLKILWFLLHCLCATPFIYWIHTSRLFVSSYYLFNTTCFGLNGHHQVYKIVDENSCSVVTLLYFAFYKWCKMLMKSFIDYFFIVVTFFAHVSWVWCMFFGMLVSFLCAACSYISLKMSANFHHTRQPHISEDVLFIVTTEPQMSCSACCYVKLKNWLKHVHRMKTKFRW
jgi:hypothetical protein